MPPAAPRVAVVLSGCGFLDGAEIHESVSALLNLSRRGAEISCFAPNEPQAHVVDHAKGEPSEGETRNVLAESARIARGQIAPLESIRVQDFDLLVFPGGFGVAKNLCDFAFKGAEMSVKPEVERVIRDFRVAEKPIAMCCIAPILAAATMPGVNLTLGETSDASNAAEALGAKHHERPVDDIVVDEAHRLVTAPAYMYGDAAIHKVEAGIAKMIEKALEMAAAPAAS